VRGRKCQKNLFVDVGYGKGAQWMADQEEEGKDQQLPILWE
jgi:hypothetical protein